MSVSVENTSTLGRKIEATIPSTKLDDLLKTKITKLSREVSLKGFRPGKVPAKVIQKQFGPSVRQEVIAELIEQTLKDTLSEKELQPAGQPVVEDIQDKDDLRFTVTFEIFPTIELTDLAEIEVNKKVVEISDEDIKSMTEKLCKNLGAWEQTSDPAEAGCRLVIDYERTIDGETDSKTDVRMELGDKATLPGLSEALIGCKKDDKKEVEITYPEKWAEEKAAGKKVTLNITVKDVLANKPLEPTTLAERLGLEEKTEEALSEKIKERMAEEANRAVFNELQEDVLELLLEKNSFDVPDALIEQERQAIKKEQSQRGGAPINDMEETAIKRVKLGLLINEVIKKYNLKADGKRLRKEVEYLAQEFPNPEEFINIYFSNKQLLSGVERIVLLQQSVEALINDMKVTEEKVSFDTVMNPES